jgi:hypothetical protein
LTDIATLGLAIDSSGANAAKSALDRLISAAEGATKAQSGLESSAGNSRLAMMELEHVIRAVVDGLAAGQNPMRLFAMEGARLAQAFQMGGGASGVLSTFGGIVSKLANPTILLTGAIAGLGAVGVAAFTGWESRLSALQVSLNGLGRSTGLTLGALNRVAIGGSGGNVSIAQAQSAVAAMAATGRISPTAMGQMLGQSGLINRYSQATGTGYGQAATTLSGYVADPTKGAEALNKEFGFLTDSTQRLITNLQASGRMLEAQGVLIRATSQDLAGSVDRTWTFEKIARGIATGASNALAATGSAVQSVLDPMLEQRYSAANSRYGNLQGTSADGERRRRALMRFGFGDPTAGAQAQLPAARSEQEDLNEQLRRQSQLASQRARDAEVARQSQIAGDIVRQTVAELSERQGLVNRRDALSSALSAPGARGGLDADAAREADDALARLNARLENFRTTAQRVAEDSTLAAQAIQAETAQERTAINALRAYTDVIRDSGDKALAAATAQAKWNEAIAESNKQAQDMLRGAQDRAGMIGMSPLQRAEQEIRNRYRDARQNSVTGPVSSLSPDDLNMTALDDSPTSILKRAMLSRARLPVDPNLDAAAELTGAFPISVDHGDIGRRAGAIGSHAATARRLVPSGIDVSAPIASRSAPMLSQAQGIEIGAARDQATSEVIRQANVELERNRQLLQVRAGALGQDTFAVNKAVAAQELWNKLQLEDADLKRLGPDRIRKVQTAIEASATKTAQFQQQQLDYQQRVQSIDQVNDLGRQFVGGAANDVFSTFNTDPRQLVGQLSTEDQAKFYGGQMSGRDVQSKLAQRQVGDLIKNMLFQQGIGMIQKGLFGSGSAGSPGSTPGLLGGLASGLIGGITGGSGGGPLDWIGHLFANGGIMTSGGPVPLRRYAGGGVANSPQLAMFGEGSSPEAYVPLPDGKSIPVAMKAANFGGGRGGQSVIVQGGDLHVHGNMDSPTLDMVQAMMAQQTKQITDNLQKSVGNVQAKWNQFNGG